MAHKFVSGQRSEMQELAATLVDLAAAFPHQLCQERSHPCDTQSYSVSRRLLYG